MQKGDQAGARQAFQQFLALNPHQPPRRGRRLAEAIGAVKARPDSLPQKNYQVLEHEPMMKVLMSWTFAPDVKPNISSSLSKSLRRSDPPGAADLRGMVHTLRRLSPNAARLCGRRPADDFKTSSRRRWRELITKLASMSRFPSENRPRTATFSCERRTSEVFKPRRSDR